MHAQDAKSFTNISATTAAFTLYGGEYLVMVAATFGGGNVAFQVLGPDGATWLAVGAAFTVNGSATARLPPGEYRFAIVTATGVTATVARVPGD